MLKEVGRIREEARTTAKTGEGGNPDGQADELPEGSSPLEARTADADAPEAAEAAPAEQSSEEGADTAPTQVEEEPIRINGQVFKTQAEAFAYAEQLARDKDVAEAHAAGVRDALEATSRPVQQNPEPEDDFEQRFYSNPKETLKDIEEKAVKKALEVIQAENHKEKLWNQFLSEYPDVRRKDAERILNENAKLFNAMTDIPGAMKTLAAKVRAEYDEIADLRRPRTTLPEKKPTVAPSGGRPASVTPAKNPSGPVDFVSEFKSVFKR
jgi:hypothetical protein